jgi:glycosyltransferase involved in cell wall biosynthesis
VISTEELTPTAGVQYLSGLQENEARALLENSGGMLFPSLYEGFGLPPIEAVLLGTPLVVSRIPSHQEGLVDLNPGEVFWNQPQDLHAWTSAFHRLQKGEVSPSSEITRMKILDRFSIEKMAQKMDLIYRGALGVKL